MSWFRLRTLTAVTSSTIASGIGRVVSTQVSSYLLDQVPPSLERTVIAFHSQWHTIVIVAMAQSPRKRPRLCPKMSDD